MGYRLLVGGAGPPTTTATQRDHGVTRALVIKRLGQAAASAAVEEELLSGSSGTGLFEAVDLVTLPGDAAFDAQVETLYRRLYAEAPDDTERAAVRELWEAVAATDGAAAAWTSVLATLMRDPRFWSY